MAKPVAKGIQFFINGTATADSRAGSPAVGNSGYFYPLFISQQEAISYDLDQNGTGSAHTHEFAGIDQTFWMPLTGATHASATRPSGIRQYVGEPSLYLNKMSKLVRAQFPDFYEEDGEKFLLFIEAYYEYLEQNGKANDALRNLMSYRDATSTIDEFIENFINSFLPSIPLDITADKRLMIKYIKYFNQSRGTLASYKLLFRALYNEDIEVEYPADQILKVSDGDWRKERYLVSSYDPATYNFIGKTIKGTESSAEALVEDIVRKNIRGRDLMQILLSNIKGTFNHLEPIRLLSDIFGEGHSPIVEAGISGVSILTPGGEYRQGDVVSLLSSDKGEFGKVVVTETQDLGGTLTFSLNDGGSGYTSSTNGGTSIVFQGGDGTNPASFVIGQSDIVDSFAIAININLLSSNTVFGNGAPTIAFANGSSGQISTFKDVVLSCPDYGFPEDGEQVGNRSFRDHSNAVLIVANTSNPNISANDSLYGETSGANATVTSVRRSYNSTDVIVAVDGYKNFSTSEKINISTANGTTVGTVSSFSGNTVGWHPVSIGVIAGNELSVGDIIRGVKSGANGVVTHVGASNGQYETPSAVFRDVYTYRVGSQSGANLTSQFDTGPMDRFIADEGVILVSSNTTVGNVVFSTSNAQVEGVYTRLSDALGFEATTFGTIASISLPQGGSGFSVAPRIIVRENNIASLGIGEQYLTLQSDDPNWNTGNSSFITVDTNDRLVQSSTGASGDVKGGFETSTVSRIFYANGTYEMVVRLWQDFNQRSPGNIEFANNQNVTINIYDSSYVPGTVDNRTPTDSGTAKIVSIDDRGILGQNANITAGVGANGTITSIRVLDSGFAYRDNEIVLIESSNRPLATSGRAQISLGGVANSEGYYATSRSHVSTLRGYLQDSEFYQEYSYQIISPISLSRYRDYALELVHPAGQALFGKFRTQSNVNIDIATTSNNQTRLMASGTVALSQGSFDVSGNNTLFQTGTHVFANGDLLTIEYAPKQFYTIPLNIVSDDTTANLTIAWSNSSISSANIYYNNGDI